MARRRFAGRTLGGPTPLLGMGRPSPSAASPGRRRRDVPSSGLEPLTGQARSQLVSWSRFHVSPDRAHDGRRRAGPRGSVGSEVDARARNDVSRRAKGHRAQHRGPSAARDEPYACTPFDGGPRGLDVAPVPAEQSGDPSWLLGGAQVLRAASVLDREAWRPALASYVDRPAPCFTCNLTVKQHRLGHRAHAHARQGHRKP